MANRTVFHEWLARNHDRPQVVTKPLGFLLSYPLAELLPDVRDSRGRQILCSRWHTVHGQVELEAKLCLSPGDHACLDGFDDLYGPWGILGEDIKVSTPRKKEILPGEPKGGEELVGDVFGEQFEEKRPSA
jgi:hypothetical protein